MNEPHEHPSRTTAAWFSGYLDWLRSDLVDRVLALSPEEQRTTRLASGWTPIELLNHVLFMEQRWFVWGFLGEDVDEPWGDWADEKWHVPEGMTAEEIADRLEGIAVRTREVLATRGLNEVAPPGPRFEDGEPPTLEWICFHVLAEYARHAGHLDVAVELGPGPA